MYFFHFSGFSLESSEISDYLPSNIARHRFSNRPDLGPLFNEYKELVVRNGHRTARTWPYTFACFTTGEPIPPELRIQYRNCPSEWLSYGNPFDSKGLKDRANPQNIPNATEVLVESKAEHTESRAGGSTPIPHSTAEEELNKILNSRAWRWASRYGRFKYRFLIPVYELLRRPLRKKEKSNQEKS